MDSKNTSHSNPLLHGIGAGAFPPFEEVSLVSPLSAVAPATSLRQGTDRCEDGFREINLSASSPDDSSCSRRPTAALLDSYLCRALDHDVLEEADSRPNFASPSFVPGSSGSAQHAVADSSPASATVLSEASGSLFGVTTSSSVSGISGLFSTLSSALLSGVVSSSQQNREPDGFLPASGSSLSSNVSRESGLTTNVSRDCGLSPNTASSSGLDAAATHEQSPSTELLTHSSSANSLASSLSAASLNSVAIKSLAVTTLTPSGGALDESSTDGCTVLSKTSTSFHHRDLDTSASNCDSDLGTSASFHGRHLDSSASLPQVDSGVLAEVPQTNLMPRDSPVLDVVAPAILSPQCEASHVASTANTVMPPATSVSLCNLSATPPVESMGAPLRRGSQRYRYAQIPGLSSGREGCQSPNMIRPSVPTYSAEIPPLPPAGLRPPFSPPTFSSPSAVAASPPSTIVLPPSTELLPSPSAFAAPPLSTTVLPPSTLEAPPLSKAAPPLSTPAPSLSVSAPSASIVGLSLSMAAPPLCSVDSPGAPLPLTLSLASSYFQTEPPPFPYTGPQLPSTVRHTPSSTEATPSSHSGPTQSSSTVLLPSSSLVTSSLSSTLLSLPSSTLVSTSSSTLVPPPFSTLVPPPSSTQVPPPSSTLVPPPSSTLVHPPSLTLVSPPSSTLVPPPSSTLVPPPSSTVIPPLFSTLVPPPSSTLVPPPSPTLVPPPSSTLVPPPSSTLAPPSSTLVHPPSSTLVPPPSSTLVPPPSSTLVPPPSSTLAPLSSTLVPPPSSTLIPPPSSTLVPPPSSTLIPPPSSTLVPPPSSTLAPSPSSGSVTHSEPVLFSQFQTSSVRATNAEKDMSAATDFIPQSTSANVSLYSPASDPGLMSPYSYPSDNTATPMMSSSTTPHADEPMLSVDSPSVDPTSVEPPSVHWFYVPHHSSENGAAGASSATAAPSVAESWQPFSRCDSTALEDALQRLRQDGGSVETVSVLGGRYQANVHERAMSPVYWQTEPLSIRRCIWFSRGAHESRYVPYSEQQSDQLEEMYVKSVSTDQWHGHVPIGDDQGYVVMHSPTLFVHHPGVTAAWESVSLPDDPSRPRQVRRGWSSVEQASVPPDEAASVNHLVFMVHGIGPCCDLRFRPVNECVDDMRQMSEQLIASHFSGAVQAGQLGRVEFMPISWYDALHSADTGVDESLKPITLPSIPLLRQFVNGTVMDVLYYTSPVYCQVIIDTVTSNMNRVFDEFCRRHPDFDGSVSLVGHSLGSVILYDLLAHQQEITGAASDQQVPPSSASVHPPAGTAGTGQSCVIYPPLRFRPLCLFGLGSPIALFSRISGRGVLGPDFRLPTCARVFNVYHPYDPVAYRLEPLIVPEMTSVCPVLIPHHKGRKRMHLEIKEQMTRVGFELKQRLFSSLQSTVSGLRWMAGGVNGALETNSGQDGGQTDCSARCDIKVGSLNGGRRVDYVLQEKPFESLNEYVFAFQSHLCYWESEDTLLMILKEILSVNHIFSDTEDSHQGISRQGSSASLFGSQPVSTSLPGSSSPDVQSGSHVSEYSPAYPAPPLPTVATLHQEDIPTSSKSPAAEPIQPSVPLLNPSSATYSAAPHVGRPWIRRPYHVPPAGAVVGMDPTMPANVAKDLAPPPMSGFRRS